MAVPPPTGTKDRPLRVGIVGAGPAGFYTAMALLEQREIAVNVDLLDRLPTPYGLVRAGVAPDHQKLKTVTRVYEKLGQDPRFRFFGNVELGRDVSVSELSQCYHQVVYATGNESDRRLGIPGEHLTGCSPASVFVGWYNGHPDYSNAEFNLAGERAVIVGNGNVAIDVARVLAKSPAALRTTDIADHALAALEQSRVREILVVGRRGPLQTSFTPSELGELTELPDLDLQVTPAELELDEADRAALHQASAKSAVRRNYKLFQQICARPTLGAGKRLEFRFLMSPLEFLGDHTGRLRQLRVCKNRLVRDDSGRVQASPTTVEELWDVDLALVSVGAESKRMADLPFDAERGVLANVEGRIVDPRTGEPLRNHYCSGWARTGAKGLIASQKTGALEIVQTMLRDVKQTPFDERAHKLDLEELLRSKNMSWISFDDWHLIDETEVTRGAQRGAPRSKLVDVPSMISVVELKRRGW